MAKKATGTSKRGAAKKASAPARKPRKALSTTTVKRSGGSGSSNDNGISDALIKLLQSPLVADLLAVAATAALAALAEHGFSSRGAGGGGRKAGRAVKEAGKAAATAIGRRLGTEIDEIRKASSAAKRA